MVPAPVQTPLALSAHGAWLRLISQASWRNRSAPSVANIRALEKASGPRRPGGMDEDMLELALGLAGPCPMCRASEASPAPGA